MGIDLPRDIGTRRLPWARLQRIIQHLPSDSATARARRNQQPDLDIQFLRRIEHSLRWLQWAKTKDAKDGRNEPVIVPLHGDNAKGSRKKSLDLDARLAARLARREAELATMSGEG